MYDCIYIYLYFAHIYICIIVYIYIIVFLYVFIVYTDNILHISSIYICIWLTYTGTDRIMEKKRFNLQAPPVYDRKVTNLFFSHNYFFHNYFFSHNSVGDCMSIDSQFECILRGNIEL